MDYAGFNIRSAAYTIDGLIVIALTYIVYYVMGSNAQAQDLSEIVQQIEANPQRYDGLGVLGLTDQLLGGGPSLAMATIVSAVYNIGFTITKWQGTPGKHWRGLKIVTIDGSKPGLVTAIIRHVATGLSTIIAFVGFMMAGWTKEKTALHDMIAGTRVIYTDSPYV